MKMKPISRRDCSKGCQPLSNPRQAKAIPQAGTAFEQELSSLAKALGHPARIRILRLLIDRQECVCNTIVHEVGLAQSTVSQHLAVLKDAGLIQGEINGTSVCYCADPQTIRRFKVLVAAL